MKYKTNIVYFNGLEINSLVNNSKIIVKLPKNRIQREYEKWNVQRIKEYVETLDNDFPHSPIYLLKFKDKFYVVDGQHRILTIKDLVIKEKATKLNISKKLFEFKVIELNDKTITEEKMILEGKEIFRILNDTSVSVEGKEERSLKNNYTEAEIKKLKNNFKNTFQTSEDNFKKQFGLIKFSVSVNDEKKLFSKKNPVYNSADNSGPKFNKVIRFLQWAKKREIKGSVSNGTYRINNQYFTAISFLFFNNVNKFKEIKFDKEYYEKISEYNKLFKNIIKKDWAAPNNITKRIAFMIFAIKKGVLEGQVINEEIITNNFK